MEIHFDDKVIGGDKENIGGLKFKNSIIERFNNSNIKCNSFLYY